MISLEVSTAALLLLATAPKYLAQISSSCNPLDQACPPDPGLTERNFHTDFTTGSPRGWTTTAGAVTYGRPDGAEFTINKQGDAPTIQTDFYVFFGQIEVTMKAAAGTGIVSSIVLLSDVLDEIDWEAIGSDNAHIMTNYFGKGNTTTFDRAIWIPVASPQDTFHRYAVTWRPRSIEWTIDGNIVRSLSHDQAADGRNFPQTPMRLRLGIWAGGDPTNPPGTIEWAGGVTDYSAAPFTMVVREVNIVNYNPAQQYVYTDRSGSMESIEIVGSGGGGGNSSAGGSSNATRAARAVARYMLADPGLISRSSSSNTSSVMAASAAGAKSSSNAISMGALMALGTFLFTM